MDSRQGIDEARIRRQHQALLKQYLVLQKEFVSKKRKFQEAKQRREVLLDEVRFLKRRRKFLLKNQSRATEEEQELAKTENKFADVKAQDTERRHSADVVAEMQNPFPAGLLWASGHGEKKNSRRKAGAEQRRVAKKTKDLFSKGDGIEKRKFSWQDRSSLKVFPTSHVDPVKSFVQKR